MCNPFNVPFVVEGTKSLKFQFDLAMSYGREVIVAKRLGGTTWEYHVAVGDTGEVSRPVHHPIDIDLSAIFIVAVRIGGNDSRNYYVVKK